MKPYRSRNEQRATPRTGRRYTALALVALMAVAACSNSTLPNAANNGSAQPGQVQTGVGGNGPSGPSTTAGVSAGGQTAIGGNTNPGSGASSGASTAVGASPVGGASPAGGSRVGVTKDAIRMMVSGPFSGIYGALFNRWYASGPELWQKEVNANGGIHGRRIELVKVDNAFTAEGAVAACKEAKSGGFFMVLRITGHTSEIDCLDAAGIPVIDSPTYLKPWKRVIITLYLPVFAPPAVSFLKNYMKAGAKKIGIVYVGDYPPIVEYNKALAAELKEQGVDLVHTEVVATNQASFVSEMSRMQASGAEVVMLLVLTEGGGIIRDAKAINYTPRWYAPAAGPASDLLTQSCGQPCVGVIGLTSITTSDSPAYAAYLAKLRKYQGDGAAASATTADANIYATADILGHILQVTGPDLTRDSIIAAAQSIVSYDNHITTPFSLKGRQPPVGLHALFPVECCTSDYRLKSLGPPQERF